MLGIDFGKNVSSVAGLDAFGRVVMSQRIRQFRLLSLLADLNPCDVAIEARCNEREVMTTSAPNGDQEASGLSQRRVTKLTMSLMRGYHDPAN